MKKLLHHPSMFILPPHMLNALAQNGNEEQRKRALQTLSHDHTIRSVRMIHNQLNQQHIKGCVELNYDKALNRTVCDDHGSTNLPGEMVRTEGTYPTSDIAANEAYDAMGWTHAFYLQVCGRNSIDDEGMALNATVHYGTQYDNAFWNGERMIFGDGDGDMFNRFTSALEVVGHELTHGIIENQAQLVCMGQSGALNESISDVFGCLIKQYSLKQRAEEADWLIGQGLFTAKVHGEALRSMKAPGSAYNDPILGKDPQPAHMNDYVHTMEDNGGVHINSGIPNHAFCMVAMKIGGYAWERAGRIWYETLCDPRLRPTTNFRTFAHLTLMQAERLFGHNSREWMAVYDSWKEVGVQMPMMVRGAIYENSAAD